ncbi:MAG: transporter, partial [Spirochaetales bacterium]|nr:transporter [Spirochaetales bacterium]
MEVSLVISKLMPVILIIILGWILKQTKLITGDGSTLLKKLIVNVGLPSVFFLSFLKMSITMSLIMFIPGMFLLNILLLFAGKGAAKITGGKYSPFLFTGFEYGMFAIAVFSAAYGTSSASYISILDVGHELFIWFVFVTVILATSNAKNTAGDTIRSFIKSPIIIAIILGFAGNLLGLEQIINSNPVLNGVETTIEMLMSLTAPLILLSIGAGLSLSRLGLSFAVKVTAIRLPVVLALIFLINKFIIREYMGLPFAYEAALFTLLIAPPPFIIHLYMSDKDGEEK